MFSSPRWYLIGEVLNIVNADYQRICQKTDEEVRAIAAQEEALARARNTWGLSDLGVGRKCNCRCPNCGGSR